MSRTPTYVSRLDPQFRRFVNVLNVYPSSETSASNDDSSKEQSPSLASSSCSEINQDFICVDAYTEENWVPPQSSQRRVSEFFIEYANVLSSESEASIGNDNDLRTAVPTSTSLNSEEEAQTLRSSKQPYSPDRIHDDCFGDDSVFWSHGGGKISQEKYGMTFCLQKQPSVSNKRQTLNRPSVRSFSNDADSESSFQYNNESEGGFEHFTGNEVFDAEQNTPWNINTSQVTTQRVQEVVPRRPLNTSRKIADSLDDLPSVGYAADIVEDGYSSTSSADSTFVCFALVGNQDDKRTKRKLYSKRGRGERAKKHRYSDKELLKQRGIEEKGSDPGLMACVVTGISGGPSLRVFRDEDSHWRPSKSKSGSLENLHECTQPLHRGITKSGASGFDGSSKSYSQKYRNRANSRDSVFALFASPGTSKGKEKETEGGQRKVDEDKTYPNSSRGTDFDQRVSPALCDAENEFMKSSKESIQSNVLFNQETSEIHREGPRCTDELYPPSHIKSDETITRLNEYGKHQNSLKSTSEPDLRQIAYRETQRKAIPVKLQSTKREVTSKLTRDISSKHQGPERNQQEKKEKKVKDAMKPVAHNSELNTQGKEKMSGQTDLRWPPDDQNRRDRIFKYRRDEKIGDLPETQTESVIGSMVHPNKLQQDPQVAGIVTINEELAVEQESICREKKTELLTPVRQAIRSTIDTYLSDDGGNGDEWKIMSKVEDQQCSNIPENVSYDAESERFPDKAQRQKAAVKETKGVQSSSTCNKSQTLEEEKASRKENVSAPYISALGQQSTHTQSNKRTRSTDDKPVVRPTKESESHFEARPAKTSDGFPDSVAPEESNSRRKSPSRPVECLNKATGYTKRPLGDFDSSDILRKPKNGFTRRENKRDKSETNADFVNNYFEQRGETCTPVLSFPNTQSISLVRSDKKGHSDSEIFHKRSNSPSFHVVRAAALPFGRFDTNSDNGKEVFSKEPIKVGATDAPPDNNVEKVMATEEVVKREQLSLKRKEQKRSKNKEHFREGGETNVSPEDVVLNVNDESTPEDADLASYIQPDKDSSLDPPLEILHGPLSGYSGSRNVIDSTLKATGESDSVANQTRLLSEHEEEESIIYEKPLECFPGMSNVSAKYQGVDSVRDNAIDMSDQPCSKVPEGPCGDMASTKLVADAPEHSMVLTVDTLHVVSAFSPTQRRDELPLVGLKDTEESSNERHVVNEDTCFVAFNINDSLPVDGALATTGEEECENVYDSDNVTKTTFAFAKGDEICSYGENTAQISTDWNNDFLFDERQVVNEDTCFVASDINDSLAGDGVLATTGEEECENVCDCDLTNKSTFALAEGDEASLYSETAAQISADWNNNRHISDKPEKETQIYVNEGKAANGVGVSVCERDQALGKEFTTINDLEIQDVRTDGLNTCNKTIHCQCLQQYLESNTESSQGSIQEVSDQLSDITLKKVSGFPPDWKNTESQTSFPYDTDDREYPANKTAEVDVVRGVLFKSSGECQTEPQTVSFASVAVQVKFPDYGVQDKVMNVNEYPEGVEHRQSENHLYSDEGCQTTPDFEQVLMTSKDCQTDSSSFTTDHDTVWKESIGSCQFVSFESKECQTLECYLRASHDSKNPNEDVGSPSTVCRGNKECQTAGGRTLMTSSAQCEILPAHDRLNGLDYKAFLASRPASYDKECQTAFSDTLLLTESEQSTTLANTLENTGKTSAETMKTYENKECQTLPEVDRLSTVSEECQTTSSTYNTCDSANVAGENEISFTNEECQTFLDSDLLQASSKECQTTIWSRVLRNIVWEQEDTEISYVSKECQTVPEMSLGYTGSKECQTNSWWFIPEVKVSSTGETDTLLVSEECQTVVDNDLLQAASKECQTATWLELSLKIAKEAATTETSNDSKGCQTLPDSDLREASKKCQTDCLSSNPAEMATAAGKTQISYVNKESQRDLEMDLLEVASKECQTITWSHLSEEIVKQAVATKTSYDSKECQTLPCNDLLPEALKDCQTNSSSYIPEEKVNATEETKISFANEECQTILDNDLPQGASKECQTMTWSHLSAQIVKEAAATEVSYNNKECQTLPDNDLVRLASKECQTNLWPCITKDSENETKLSYIDEWCQTDPGIDLHLASNECQSVSWSFISDEKVTRAEEPRKSYSSKDCQTIVDLTNPLIQSEESQKMPDLVPGDANTLVESHQSVVYDIKGIQPNIEVQALVAPIQLGQDISSVQKLPSIDHQKTESKATESQTLPDSQLLVSFSKFSQTSDWISDDIYHNKECQTVPYSLDDLIMLVDQLKRVQDVENFNDAGSESIFRPFGPSEMSPFHTAPRPSTYGKSPEADEVPSIEFLSCDHSATDKSDSHSAYIAFSPNVAERGCQVEMCHCGNFVDEHENESICPQAANDPQNRYFGFFCFQFCNYWYSRIGFRFAVSQF